MIHASVLLHKLPLAHQHSGHLDAHVLHQQMMVVPVWVICKAYTIWRRNTKQHHHLVNATTKVSKSKYRKPCLPSCHCTQTDGISISNKADSRCPRHNTKSSVRLQLSSTLICHCEGQKLQLATQTQSVCDPSPLAKLSKQIPAANGDTRADSAGLHSRSS